MFPALKLSAGLDERQEHGLSIARSLSSTERCPLTRIPYKETVGSPKFPSYPHEYMPWSQTPVVSRILAIAHPGLLLSDTMHRVSFHLKPSEAYPNDHNYTYFGAQYRACILAFPGFRLPLPGLPADSATDLLATL